MTVKSQLRCGAAMAAVSAMMLVTAPGFAQDNGLQNSTPAEQAQTRALNENAVDGSNQPAAVLNGGQYAQQQPAGYGGSRNDYDGPNGDQQYQSPPPNAPQQRYDQQQQEYRDQRQQYDSDTAQYRANLRAYDRAMYDWSYPAPISYEYRGAHLWRLALLADPTHQLFEVPIEGPRGEWVGRVRNVELGPAGPARIEVALNRRVSVWVDPADLRFDADRRVLLTDLTRSELWQMPGATVESGPM
jgi:hypothetical protein